MSASLVKELDIDKVPIIDIGSLRDNSDPTSVATELYSASTGLGFIYIKNHGISPVSYTHLTLPTTWSV